MHLVQISMDIWQERTFVWRKKQAYLEGRGIRPSRCDPPSVMLVFAGGPGKPLLPNDGRFPALIYTIGESLCVLREEGDERILSAHSQLPFGCQDVSTGLVCPVVLSRPETLSRCEASLQSCHKRIGFQGEVPAALPLQRQHSPAMNVNCQGNAGSYSHVCMYKYMHAKPVTQSTDWIPISTSKAYAIA